MTPIEKRLSHDQLAIIMHLANGKQIDEIADEMHFSRSNVDKHLARARKAVKANTLPHLVSIAIGAGALVWEPKDESRSLVG